MNKIAEDALRYGCAAGDMMMKKYPNSQDIPPKGGFHYHAGVFNSGLTKLYEVCGEEKYFDYMKSWVDGIVKAPGIVDRYMKGALDDYMAAILLFPLYERTHDEKYAAALHMMMANIRNWVRNEKGGFWHKEWRPHQMWLDGLYMAGPLQALYAKKFGDKYFSDEAVHQAVLMYENMQDKETKLLYHAWDASKAEPWANKDTGLAPEFWGRALGWYVIAVLDIMETLDQTSPEYKKLFAIEKEVLCAALSYQSNDTGLWYQVLDKEKEAGNWAESSCSCMYVYAAAKAVRLGVIDEKYLDNVRRGFEAITNAFVTTDGTRGFTLGGVCIGTGVMDYQGYINRPTCENDLHGIGAFLLMCAELAKLR